LNVTQNESKNEAGFLCSSGNLPKLESADAAIHTAMPITNEHNNNCYLTDNLQTLMRQRMSHLLRHSAATDKVAMTSQGYLNIVDLIKWLYSDIKVHVTMADITNIAEHDVKARYKIVNGQI